jgi:pimeloyl-ACP methyl ester carboxylesterase
LLSCSGEVEPPGISADFPEYVRDTGGRAGVIVFVHGVLGNARSTWTNDESHAFWPQLLTEDEVFDGFNIYVYEYPSPLFSTSLNQDEVAENMRLRLEAAGVTDHSEIIFLVHSMGGIIARSYLQKYQDVADRVKFIYFFSTPTEGAEIARLGKFLSRNPQFGRMVPIDADSYLADMIRSWQAARFGIRSFCAYEKQPLSPVGIIVEMASAAALCTERLDPIDATHVDIVKPVNQNSVPYIAFKTAFMKTRRSIKINIIEGTTFEDAVRAAVATDRNEDVVGSHRFVNCTPDERSARLRTGSPQAASVSLLIQRLASREGTDFFDVNVTLDERNRIYDIECLD